MDPDPEKLRILWIQIQKTGFQFAYWKYICMKAFLKNYLHIAPPLVKKEEEGGVGGSHSLVVSRVDLDLWHVVVG